MTLREWFFVSAFLITLLSAGIALFAGWRDHTERARRRRARSIGVAIWAFVIPAWLFLEEPLGSRGASGALTYIAFLALIVFGGMIMYVRGHGFREWP